MESFHHLFAAMKRKTIYFVQDLTSQVTFGALLQITRSSYVLISIFNMYVILCVSFRFLIRTFFGDCLYAQTKIFALSGHESCSHQKQTFSLKRIKSEARSLLFVFAVCCQRQAQPLDWRSMLKPSQIVRRMILGKMHLDHFFFNSIRVSFFPFFFLTRNGLVSLPPHHGQPSLARCP